MNRLGGEWETQLQVGQDTHLFTQFYQPLSETSRLFVAPYLLIGQQTRGVFIEDDRVADFFVKSRRVGIDLGSELGTWGQVRFGPQLTQIDARVETGSPVLPSVDEKTGGLRAGLFVDQVDHAFFPTHGYAVKAAAYAAMKSLGSDREYRWAQAELWGAESWGPHVLGYLIAGGSHLGSDLPPYESFALGGPLRLSGYRLNQFAGNQYAFGRLMYYRRIVALPETSSAAVSTPAFRQNLGECPTATTISPRRERCGLDRYFLAPTRSWVRCTSASVREGRATGACISCWDAPEQGCRSPAPGDGRPAPTSARPPGSATTASPSALRQSRWLLIISAVRCASPSARSIKVWSDSLYPADGAAGHE